MGPFARVHDPDYYAAAFNERQRNGTSYRDLERMCAAGTLPGLDGKPMPAHRIPYSTFNHALKELERKRAGKAVSPLANEPVQTAVNALRARLVTVADEELSAEERKGAGNRDMARIQALTKLAKEIASTAPVPRDEKPTGAGKRRPDGTKEPGRELMRTPLAEQILAADRKATTAPDNPTHHNETRKNADAKHDAQPNAQTDEHTDEAHGSRAWALVGGAGAGAAHEG